MPYVSRILNMSSALQIKAYYGVKRNLLIKFKDDSIDETPRLAQILAQKSAVSAFLDLTLRALPGDHSRPCLQVRHSFQGVRSITFFRSPLLHPRIQIHHSDSTKCLLEFVWWPAVLPSRINCRVNRSSMEV